MNQRLKTVTTRFALLCAAILTYACESGTLPIDTRDREVESPAPAEPNHDPFAPIPSPLTRQPEYVPPTSQDMTVQSTKAACRRPDVKYVRVAIHPDQPERGSFNFAYQQINRNPSQPTVIFLTGGPGQDAIDDLQRPIIPTPLNYINLDPRSMGCNLYQGSEDLQNSGISTENYAADIIAVIKTLNLTNYIIYGVSYGTMIASVLAHKIEQQNLVPPKSVVLLGVIGKFNDQYFHEFVTQWNGILLRHPTIEALFQEARLPFGYTEEQWNNAISPLLSFYPAAFEEDMTRLADAPSYARSSLEQQMKSFYNNFITDKPLSTAPGFDNFYKQIACREMAQVEQYAYFYRGRLYLEAIPQAQRTCNNIPLDRRYDSVTYPIKSPVYYFQGDRDPNTPLRFAEHHFNNQQDKANKKFVKVQGAGHGAFEIELEKCKNSLWNIMAKNQDVQSALTQNGTCAGTSLVAPSPNRSFSAYQLIH